MTITPEKYIRKPLIVLGVQVTKENFMELALWVQGSIQNNDGSQGGQIDPPNQYIMVRVVSPKTPRQSRAFVGDWILYSDRGYKVYTPKAFNNTFDPVKAEFKMTKTEATRVDEKEKDDWIGEAADIMAQEERLDNETVRYPYEKYEAHYEAEKVKTENDQGIREQLVENKRRELEDSQEELDDEGE
jgi:hypothetical protein